MFVVALKQMQPMQPMQLAILFFSPFIIFLSTFGFALYNLKKSHIKFLFFQ